MVAPEVGLPAARALRRRAALAALVHRDRLERQVPDLGARPVSELRLESRGRSAPQAIWQVKRTRRSRHREAWQEPVVRQGLQALRVQQRPAVQRELSVLARALRQAPPPARLPPTAVQPLLRPEPERVRLPELPMNRQIQLGGQL